MTISDNLITTIKNSAQIQSLELNDGRILTNQDLHAVPSRGSLRGASFRTLSSFCDFCQNTAPSLPNITSSAYIHVIDPQTVVLREPEILDESSAVNDAYAYADASSYVTYKDRGEYRSQSETVIRLMTKFIDTKHRAGVIKLVSSLTDSEVTTSEDDGFSQSVTVKTGVQRKVKADVQPYWYLAPIRTFLDIEQPESLFLIRIRSHESISLYEADCSLWVLDAVQKVVDYLKAKELPYPIYG